MSLSSSSQWNMENTLKLIDDFRENPCLWDHTLPPLQKSRDKRLKIYNELAQKYCVGVNELVKKLHHLKFQFLRELKKLREHEAGENDEAWKNKKSSWFGFTPLLFLLNQTYHEGDEISSLAYDTTDLEIKSSLDMLEAVDCSETDNNTKSISSQAQTGVDRTEIDHNTKIISSQSQTVIEKSSVKTEPIKLENDTLKCMKSLIDVVNKHDEFSVYGDYIADKMRNCGRSQKEIHIAQHHIDNVTFNLIMGVYGRGATITPPSSNGSTSKIPNFALKEEKM
ncbi:uncharacterized protein LOC129944692 [Eupeodes corollae]|uniref:uncharacterized protein LOC129944692 n=1 Tax=Eupeodes corollae TaxID=290404 RepID=UPI002490AB06|nr:uncharacterized protein LOC129944692 [Eupeodes corollae]